MLTYSQLYPSSEGPRYVRGHAVTLGLVAMAAIVYGLMSVYFTNANKRRTRGDEDAKFAGMGAEEIDELGDRSPRFMFAT
jgi:hypothetical protein